MAKRRKKDKDYYARWGRLHPRHSVLTPEEAGSSVEAWRDFARAKTYPYLPYDPRNPASWLGETLGENPRFRSIVDPVSNKVVGLDKTQAQILKDEDDALFAEKKARKKKKRAAARADRERKTAAAQYRGPGDRGVGYRQPLPTPSFYDPGKVPEWRRDVFPLDKPPPSERERNIAAFLASDSEGPVFTSTDRPWTSVQDDSSSIGHNPFVEGPYNRVVAQVGIPGTRWPARDDYGAMSKFYEGYQGPKYWSGDWDYRVSAAKERARMDAQWAAVQAQAEYEGFRSPDDRTKPATTREEATAAPEEVVPEAVTEEPAIEEIDVYREGEVPEKFTFKANEERTAEPVKVQDLGKEEKVPPGSGEVVLPKTQPTNNFEDRLGLYNISIPAFTGRAKATIANRKTLQQRRDVLRAFQGMGPKDIVWADKMTTTEMLKLHDREVSRMIAQAMFATNPQDRRQLSQLGNKLGVNMKEWGLMQDRFEKSRPDLERQKTQLEVDTLRIEGMIGPAAAVAWQKIAFDEEIFIGKDGSEEKRAVPTSDAVRKARIEAFLATPMPTEARKAMLAEFEKLQTEDSGKTEMYVMPVMYKNTSFNKNMLKQLRIPFVERDGTGHHLNPFQGEEGKPWLMLRNFRENILPLNLGEPLTRSYINRMINAPGEYRGFQQAITGENVPQMQLFADGQAVEGSIFSNNNTGLKAYYQSLARLQGSKGWPRMTIDSAERGLKQFESAKNVRAGTIYKDLIEASNYAGNVADLTKTILDADDLHKVLGGQAGVKLAAINAVQLLGDWGSLLGLELDPETSLRVEQMSAGPATRAFNERMSEVTDKTLREGKLVIEQKMREGIFSKSLGNIMLQHNRELRDEYDTAKGVAGTNFQQEAIHARLLAISLATMGARMLSRNDRLLKDQYQAWKDETKIHDLLKSHRKARSIIVAMNRMASRMQANKAATAQAMLPPPPAVSYSGEANAWMPTNTGDEVVNRFMEGYNQRNLNQ